MHNSTLKRPLYGHSEKRKIVFYRIFGAELPKFFCKLNYRLFVVGFAFKQIAAACGASGVYIERNIKRRGANAFPKTNVNRVFAHKPAKRQIDSFAR